MKKTLLRITMAAGLFVSYGLLANNVYLEDFSKAASGQALPVIDTSIELTVAEETDLAFMREEEKLARDVYLHLFETWGSKIFRTPSLKQM